MMGLSKRWKERLQLTPALVLFSVKGEVAGCNRCIIFWHELRPDTLCFWAVCPSVCMSICLSNPFLWTWHQTDLHRNDSHVSQTCTWTSRLSDLDLVVRGQRSRSPIRWFFCETQDWTWHSLLCVRWPYLLLLCVKESIFQSSVLLCSNMDFWSIVFHHKFFGFADVEGQIIGLAQYISWDMYVNWSLTGKLVTLLKLDIRNFVLSNTRLNNQTPTRHSVSQRRALECHPILTHFSPTDTFLQIWHKQSDRGKSMRYIHSVKKQKKHISLLKHVFVVFSALFWQVSCIFSRLKVLMRWKFHYSGSD